MAKLLATIKAIITRILFASHGFLAIWQVTQTKNDFIYWYLCAPIGLLVLEGVFTLAIKKNQEWRWFCPSVFLYLVSVVPAIWLLELDKMVQRTQIEESTKKIELNTAVGMKNLNKLLDTFGGINLPNMPTIQVDSQMWITLIEQFLMLILIIGRWMLPKGDLTRDQLSQLLLVYIGTAADIIEFFDSYKDKNISTKPLLVYLTLGIWSWSLLQFTIVLSATRSRKPRGGGGSAAYQMDIESESDNCCSGCCNIDVWGIALNILLQDAPFLAFRLLIIIHYRIISYMNVFFTCKNTLVILLQLYRLYVVHTEGRRIKKENMMIERKNNNALMKHQKKRNKEYNTNKRSHELDDNNIFIISNRKYDKKNPSKRSKKIDETPTKKNDVKRKHEKSSKKRSSSTTKSTAIATAKKDTGYSTASNSSESDTDTATDVSKHVKEKRNSKHLNDKKRSNNGDKSKEKKKQTKDIEEHRSKNSKSHKSKRKEKQKIVEESCTDSESQCKYEVVHEKSSSNSKNRKNRVSSSSSETSSETEED